jgi:hypothetical protein
MAGNVYTGIFKMGDSNYYSRQVFDVDRAVQLGNATDVADAETKIVAHFQSMADASGAVLQTVTKSIHYDASVTVPDADPEFENEHKMLLSDGNGNTTQVRVPAVEPGFDVTTWFGSATLYNAVLDLLVSYGESIVHKQKRPRVSI